MYSNGKVEKMRKSPNKDEYRRQDEKRNKPKPERRDKREKTETE